ncbi:MAG TPA: LCP family protein [Mycobacteriales bacterium]|nr:LCP family protein [Mycobacteriales bacterium]
MTEPPDDQPSQRRQLPPELDPRRPVTRRPAKSPRAAAAQSSGPGSPVPPGGEYRRWGPGWLRRWTRRRLLSTVAGGMALVLLATVGVGWLTVSSILGSIKHINPFCHSCDRPGGGAVGDLNILIVGSDSRAGLTKAQQKQLHVGHDPGQRSDTMILLHIPSGGAKAVMVSLPRDSYVRIPAHRSGGHLVPASMNKLNAAYSLGGAKLTIKTVEANTHVRIDHYIEINFYGFVKMVNALGGVNICNATAIHDPIRYSSATGGYIGSGLELAKGEQHLDGNTALEYVRAREFDPAQGDLGRIHRQQKFMAAMMNKAESTGVLLDLPKLYSFLKAVAGSLTTDDGLGTSQMLRLAKALHSMSPKNVDLLTVPLSNTAYATPVGSAVLWDPVLSKRLFHDFSADKSITNVIGHSKLTIPPGSISLTVLNATSTQGLASRAAGDLSRLGFGISGTPSNAPKGTNPNATVVQYGPSRADSAKTVAAAVTGATEQEVASLGDKIQLLVGSTYEGVKPVHISSTSSSRPTVTTGASNPCS